MPLLDHFHPPLLKRWHWESFHHTWATILAGQLNEGVLPQQYLAEPHIKLGVEIESDVGTFDETGWEAEGQADGGTAIYAPPNASLSLPLDFAGIDTFEIQISDEEGPGDLVAAIELVSPANKDRAAHRKAFTTKCVSYLQNGVAVIVVDVVTARRANLHTELLAHLGHDLEANGHPVGPLYGVAYRAVPKRKKIRLEAWPEALAVGAELPTLPLWLTRDCAVPVDLERSYRGACKFLRIRQDD
jgi:Protein of unknown function (DUF4058)